MHIQQAIFTSVRSGRNEGYQIAANSPGIPSQQLRELSQWGPGHDSLYGELGSTECINYHRMTSGIHCVSQTVLAGPEYSGRGGQRVYTHMYLVPPNLFTKFGNSPFRVMQSLVVSGRFQVQEDLPAQLEPLELVGRASQVNLANLEHVARKLGPQRLASLVCAALRTSSVGVCSNLSGKRLISTLIDLLPPQLRSGYALSTGLKASASRQYQLVVLPLDPEERRRAIRQVRLEVLDLTNDPPAKFAPNTGWPQLVFSLLRSEQFGKLAQLTEHLVTDAPSELDLEAERIRERLENEAEDSRFKSLTA